MNNTENKAEIKIEQSTDSDMKSVRDFNHQLTIPGQLEEMPSLKSPQTHGIDFGEIKGQYMGSRCRSRRLARFAGVEGKNWQEE